MSAWCLQTFMQCADRHLSPSSARLNALICGIWNNAPSPKLSGRFQTTTSITEVVSAFQHSKQSIISTVNSCTVVTKALILTLPCLHFCRGKHFQSTINICVDARRGPIYLETGLMRSSSPLYLQQNHFLFQPELVLSCSLCS